MLKLRTNLLVLVQVDSPGIRLDLQRYNLQKKWPLKLLCLPLLPKADLMSGIFELGKEVLRRVCRVSTHMRAAGGEKESQELS